MEDLALDDKIVINGSFEMALQEIDILFNTRNTELLGDTSYGTNWERFLWDLIPNCDVLEKYIREKIQTSTLFLNTMRYDLFVDYLINEGETIYVIKIGLYKSEGEIINKEFNISKSSIFGK